LPSQRCGVRSQDTKTRLHPWCKQVDFNAAKEYEMIVNYKVLQAAFTKNGISKVCVLRYDRARAQHSCALAPRENQSNV